MSSDMDLSLLSIERERSLALSADMLPDEKVMFIVVVEPLGTEKVLGGRKTFNPSAVLMHRDGGIRSCMLLIRKARGNDGLSRFATADGKVSS